MLLPVILETLLTALEEGSTVVYFSFFGLVLAAAAWHGGGLRAPPGTHRLRNHTVPSTGLAGQLWGWGAHVHTAGAD